MHRALLCHHLYPFKDMVHGGTKPVCTVDFGNTYIDCAAFGKESLKGGTDGSCAAQPWPARMDADDFVFVGPDAHHLFQISAFQAVIKSSFHVIGCAVECSGLLSGSGSCHSAIFH